MTHDPWSLQQSLACPSCHVVGKVVRFEREDGGYQCCDDEHLDDVDPYTCVECGQTFADTGQVGDVKEYRVQYMRLVEGRPYEPPRPKEPKEATPHPFASAFDGLLADAWRKDIEERAKQPPLDFSKLKKSAHTYSADDFTFHGPIRLPWPSSMGPIAEGNTDGTYRVTKVCQATGTITVEYEKK